MHKSNIIDLTFSIDNELPTFDAAWHPEIELTKLGSHESVGRQTKKITMGTHSGTHIDAPLHFVKDGISISDIPLDLFIGPITIVDFRHLKQDEEISPRHLENIEFSKRILLIFGWNRYWKTQKYYNNYPFFSLAAADVFIKKGVKLIAMDTPSPDQGGHFKPEDINTEKDSPIHKHFLKNQIILIEYLANTDLIDVSYNNWTLCALPLKIKDGDGSPARICIFRTDYL